jgi:lysozyme family protein
MTNIPALIAKNEDLWAKTEILPARMLQVNHIAARLCAPMAKARYQEISKATGVPWFVIAVIHEREASQDFTRQLGQGDPLAYVSRHVPRGRGPFLNHPSDPPLQDAFYRGAVDALVNCPPYAARWKNWTAGGTLTLLILYNGTGYEDYHHENSPYDWGATNQEQRGKYVADGKFDPGVWDTQVGCAAMLKGMMAIDPSIVFDTAAGAYVKAETAVTAETAETVLQELSALVHKLT